MSGTGYRVVAAHEPGLADHFPGRPLVPAVLILAHAIAAAPGTVTGVRSAKFLRPLAPDTPFRVRGTPTAPGRWRFSVRDAADQELAHGELELASA
ncbi:MAG: hypothetical protein U5K43_09300 [Halofilum sp. (in: g-proteobacteria)]|nr:hypothetical protein [Halofilum sp. (in: g-proteobacteria)]